MGIYDEQWAENYNRLAAILVSQHINPDSKAQDFFKNIATLLKPGSLLYSADVNFGAGQSRESLMELWRSNVIMSGIETKMADAMLSKVVDEIRPRDEEVILRFIQRAGFESVFMPFRSSLYGSWAARKGAGLAGEF